MMVEIIRIGGSVILVPHPSTPTPSSHSFVSSSFLPVKCFRTKCEVQGHNLTVKMIGADTI